MEQTQETVVTPTEVTAEAPKTDIDSDRFAKLASKEAKLVKEREEFKKQITQFNEDKERLKFLKEKVEQFEELRKTNKYEALKFLEFSDEDLLNLYVDHAPKELTPEEKAIKAAQEARDEVENLKKSLKEKEESTLKETQEKAIQNFKGLIKKSIEAESDKYQETSYYGESAQDLVYETVLAYMNDDKDLNPHEALKEALEAVEAYYDADYTERSKLKKRQIEEIVEETMPEPKDVRTRTKVAPPSPDKQVARATQKTLTNKMAPTSTTAVQKRETPEQKRARLENVLRSFAKK